MGGCEREGGSPLVNVAVRVLRKVLDREDYEVVKDWNVAVDDWNLVDNILSWGNHCLLYEEDKIKVYNAGFNDGLGEAYIVYINGHVVVFYCLVDY